MSGLAIRSLAAALGLVVLPLRAEAAPVSEMTTIGLTIGKGVVAAFAVLIAASVVAKMLIVVGAIPKTPVTGMQRTIHALANVVGGLGLARSPGIRRRNAGVGDRGGRSGDGTERF